MSASKSAANAALISAAINALPELLDELEQLRKENMLLTAPRIVVLTSDNCDHNREIDPDTGVCADCGTMLP